MFSSFHSIVVLSLVKNKVEVLHIVTPLAAAIDFPPFAVEANMVEADELDILSCILFTTAVVALGLAVAVVAWAYLTIAVVTFSVKLWVLPVLPILDLFNLIGVDHMSYHWK